MNRNRCSFFIFCRYMRDFSGINLYICGALTPLWDEEQLTITISADT